MYKKAAIIIAIMALAFGSSAQWEPKADSDTSRWDFHLSAGTTALSVMGRGNAYIWAAPKVEYKATERLTLLGGFSAVGSLLGGYELRGNMRSYVPVRRGTQMVGFGVGAEYRVNDRLNLWFSVSHIGGWHESLWLPYGESLPVGVTTLSGGFSYEFSDASFLEMHFHFVHDHYGNDALGLLGHPYYGWGVPAYELYSGPWPF